MIGLWAPVVAFMALIYLLSARETLPITVHGWDKLAHVSAFGIFGALSLRAFNGGIGRLALAPSALAILLTLAYAAVDEMHQARVPGRVASLGDWVADAVGASLALLLMGGLAALLPARTDSGNAGPEA